MARQEKKERARPDEDSVLWRTLEEGRIPYQLLDYDDGEFTDEFSDR